MERRGRSLKEPAGHKSPARRKRVDKRRQILDGALRVFLREGFRGASVDRVAEEAGVSKATLYRYFRTKEELFSALIAREAGDTSLATAVRGGGARSGSVHGPERSPAESLRSALYESARQLLTWAAAGRHSAELFRLVVGESRRFPSLARLIHDQVVVPRSQTLNDLVREAGAAGVVRPMEPHLFIRLFLSLLVGYLVTGHLAEGPESRPLSDPAEVAATLCEAFWAGVAAPAPAAVAAGGQSNDPVAAGTSAAPPPLR